MVLQESANEEFSIGKCVATDDSAPEVCNPRVALTLRNSDSAKCSLYYSYVRALKPNHVVVIGQELANFAICVAEGMREIGGGSLSLIRPPSLRIGERLLNRLRAAHDDSVGEHFKLHGVEDIVTGYDWPVEHFFAEYERHRLPKIDMAIVDGDRPFRNVRLDLTCVIANSHRDSIVFLHGNNLNRRKSSRSSRIRQWLNRMKEDEAGIEIVALDSGPLLIRITQG